jgi:branched-chain amino acid transport system ATP-binding protein
MSDILTVRNLTKKFGSLTAVGDLSFEVRQGEILGLMGPNGAGKTTVFNLLTGVYQPDGGSIAFEGADITTVSPARRCRLGIGRTYQVPRPFEKMTVFENMLVCAVHGGGMPERVGRDYVDDVLRLIDLYDKREDLAGGMPLLDRKRLELGKALSTDPKLVLIDEVAGGLTEKESEQLLAIVKKIQQRGVTIVWIEHILMMMSEGGVDRLLCIAEGGRHLTCGDPGEVMCSPEVEACYLGVEED